MTKLPFKIEKTISTLSGSDTAYLNPDDDPAEALAQTVLHTLGIDIEVTIGDTTMFLAAWRDPDHWAGDWAEKFDCNLDDAPARVALIIANATSE